MNTSARNLVLLVDDNHTHQYSLGKHLNRAGFEIMEAHTGAQALALARSRTPDVILLDIHLPDTIGFDVCRELKEDATTAAIPVIFHSATYDTQSAKSLAADLGAVSFLSYPIDVDHLIFVLRGTIARSKGIS